MSRSFRRNCRPRRPLWWRFPWHSIDLSFFFIPFLPGLQISFPPPLFWLTGWWLLGVKKYRLFWLPFCSWSFLPLWSDGLFFPSVPKMGLVWFPAMVENGISHGKFLLSWVDMNTGMIPSVPRMGLVWFPAMAENGILPGEFLSSGINMDTGMIPSVPRMGLVWFPGMFGIRLMDWLIDRYERPPPLLTAEIFERGDTHNSESRKRFAGSLVSAVAALCLEHSSLTKLRQGHGSSLLMLD